MLFGPARPSCVCGFAGEPGIAVGLRFGDEANGRAAAQPDTGQIDSRAKAAGRNGRRLRGARMGRSFVGCASLGSRSVRVKLYGKLSNRIARDCRLNSNGDRRKDIEKPNTSDGFEGERGTGTVGASPLFARQNSIEWPCQSRANPRRHRKQTGSPARMTAIINGRRLPSMRWRPKTATGPASGKERRASPRDLDAREDEGAHENPLASQKKGE